jgi:hypothetical protein
MERNQDLNNTSEVWKSFPDLEVDGRPVSPGVTRVFSIVSLSRLSKRVLWKLTRPEVVN